MNVKTAAFRILYRKGPGDTYVLVASAVVVPLSGRQDEHATAYADALREHRPSCDGQYVVQNTLTEAARTFQVSTQPVIEEI